LWRKLKLFGLRVNQLIPPPVLTPLSRRYGIVHTLRLNTHLCCPLQMNFQEAACLLPGEKRLEPGFVPHLYLPLVCGWRMIRCGLLSVFDLELHSVAHTRVHNVAMRWMPLVLMVYIVDGVLAATQDMLPSTHSSKTHWFLLRFRPF
jgi:hypothetical protein